MFNFIKNKFAFIIAISILTLIILIAGSIILYKDNSKIFENEGYIISTTTKKNNKYYFSPNTKYKENVDNNITFKDSDSKSVIVSSDNFVHYQNGSIGFLTKGAILNLSEINSTALNYYNVNNDDIITYKNNTYTVKSNKGNVNIESFIGRISDNKYIIAGKNITLKLPNNSETISGDYFEILFIENGIVKIDNQETSYQVTAQDSIFSIGGNTTIDLGSGKIFYNGEAKMLMSQLTINGDENIDIDTVDDKKTGQSGTGSEEGTDGSGGEGGTEEGTTEGTENGENGKTDNNETGTEGENGESGNGNGTGKKVEQAAQIELIEANVTSTGINLSFQLNNASAIKGNLIATLTNVGNNNKEYEKTIDAKNGTFKLNKESLSPDTEYTLTITETTSKSEKQYFQKTFKTSALGVTLEKEYATSSSLAYTINFEENTDASKVKVAIYDNSGKLVTYADDGKGNTEGQNSYIVSSTDISKTIEFIKLKSNSNYSIKIESVWIKNVEYADVYTINRIDTTLKKTPILSDITVGSNAEEVKFNIKLNKITDPDNAIQSFRYQIYKADDITLTNPNPEPVYAVNKNDTDELILNLNEIEELKTGIDYRCKVIALYNDNTMIREASSDYSANFLIKGKPKITFKAEKTTINSVSGTLKLTDGNCSVPISGRTCSNRNNNFTIRYYESGQNETTAKELYEGTNKKVTFNSSSLEAILDFTGLRSNTTYAAKLYGNYYDDDNILHENVQIGDVFYIKTDASENLKFRVVKDNESGVDKNNSDIRTAPIVTFDARLEAPEDSTLNEEVSSITFNLYSGSYNVENKLIGTYIMNNKAEIADMFNNYTITNKIFRNPKMGEIDTVNKLIALTNNQSGTLNSTYTVEVVDVMDSAGVNRLYVEDNVYTFKLTSSYYLDVRIGTNTSSKYITVTPIKNESLTENEREELKRTVRNLDELNDDTIVGLTIENNLTDTFVDSAYDYEKVVVDYLICNKTLDSKCNENEVISADATNVKKLSIDMGNKYQPKIITMYLDPTQENDNNSFVRGYNYVVYYKLNFILADGKETSTTYGNTNLQEKVEILKQSPIYTQNISTSTSNNITYRYSITDIDKAIADDKIYYSYKDTSDTKLQTEDSIIIDGNRHDITIPIDNEKEYSIFFKEKGTKSTYREIDKYTFEKEHNYDDQIAYKIVNDNDNMLKIKILDNDVTRRAQVYKVTIKDNNNSLNDYERYFLSSKLITKKEETGELDEEGNPITINEKYISIDYANIKDYMQHDLKITVSCYYNSGLVGFDQRFPNGMVLYNEKKYMSVFVGSNVTPTISDYPLGINILKNGYEKDGNKIGIYNYLYLASENQYNIYDGARKYEGEITSQTGATLDLVYTNTGIILKSGKTEYEGYKPKVLNLDTLKTDNNNYRFNSITPKVSLVSNNTINSLKLKVNSTGVYGQFKKDGQEHNKFYINVYSSEEISNTNLIKTLESNITITDTKAESEEVELKNLNPDTKYYVTISAYIDGVLTRLYDSDSSKGYILKTYETSTLSGESLLNVIKFQVQPVSYNNESSNKELSWKLDLTNTENYKIRFELYDINDNPANFDGTVGSNCNKNTLGTASNKYISNCYIQVPKDDIETINKKDINYIFTGNSFVFGGNYYKLKLYAIPYTNNIYDEEKKVVLYENDSLTTENKPKYKINIPTLKLATFSLNNKSENTLISGTRCITEKDEDGNTIYNGESPVCDSSADSSKVEYYIEFVPTVEDEHYVINYGTYTIKLKDNNNEVVDTKTNVSASTIGEKKITFAGLKANELYYVELSYETYRNNAGLTEQEKIATTPFTDFIYTPIDAGITLGTITALQSEPQKITLTYNGAYNMINNIKKVSYTIAQKSGSSTASGTYEISSETPNIFTISSDKTPKLIIDITNSSDPNFNLRSGNTYIITTQYWYKDGNNYIILKDHNTNNDKFTTILNL